MPLISLNTLRNALALGLILLAIPHSSMAVVVPPLSDADFRSDKWGVRNAGPVPVAGVTARASGYRALAISPVCESGTSIKYSVAFSVALGNLYSVFVSQQFMPGFAAGAVSSDLRVDDGSPFYLDDLDIHWEAGRLTLIGTISRVTHKEAMERGTEIFADINFKGAVLITQGFSLRGSSDALAELSCP